MGSPLPPDPYLALGVPKDANQAAVKTAHRKLVLKCHPDKVTDPAAKQAASDQFHKIQTAYEILVDEDRRARYDAQVRLAELRKEALERQGGKSSRGVDRSAPSPYKSSQEPAAPRGAYNVRAGDRPAPQYEERRPAYAPENFDQQPRATARKEPEYERAFRRPAHDSKDKPRAAAREAKEKETEKERRRERARRADQDARRDRDRKYSAAYVEDESDSDSDEYTRRARKMREEDELRRARDAYNEKVYKQKQEATSGYFDDRTRKMFAASADAWDYIRSSRSRQKPETERHPSPPRQTSSKDKFDYVKGKDGRPSVVVRRPSERPKTSGRDAEPSRRTSPKEPERRSSAETIDEIRRPPSLNQSRSSPADIRVPDSTDKPRAQSVQVDKETMPDIQPVKRAETMPYNPSRRSENAVPQRGRPTEFTEGLATPATTPEWTGPSGPNSTKFNYGRQYADDEEYPTPDGYRTELRQPPEGARPKFTRRVTKSPSPVRDSRDVREARDARDARDSRETRDVRDPRESRERERPRTTSSRYPETTRPAFANTRTTSYVYAPGSGGVEPLERPRPTTARTVDPRDPRLYGEIRPSTGSPRQRNGAFDPPEDSVRYQRPIRPEDIRVQSGHNYRRPSADRPTLSRSGSGNPIYTSARA